MLLASVGTALVLAVVAVGPRLTDRLRGVGDDGAKTVDTGSTPTTADAAATAPIFPSGAAGAEGDSRVATESSRPTPAATSGAAAPPRAVEVLVPSLGEEPDATLASVPLGWVCEGSIRLQDPRGRDWQIRQIGFLVQPRYERVVLHLERTGSGRAAPSSLTAQSFATTAIRDFAPVAVPPRSGTTTLGVHLADGFGSVVSLRHYRPQGTRLVRELSVYPAGRMSSAKVLISTTSRGCFRLRVPAWEDPVDPDVLAAQVQIDIR